MKEDFELPPEPKPCREDIIIRRSTDPQNTNEPDSPPPDGKHVVLTTKGVQILNEEEFRIWKMDMTMTKEEKAEMSRRLFEDLRRIEEEQEQKRLE